MPAFSLHLLTVYLEPGGAVTTVLSALLPQATMVSTAPSPSLSELLDQPPSPCPLSISHSEVLPEALIG